MLAGVWGGSRLKRLGEFRPPTEARELRLLIAKSSQQRGWCDAGGRQYTADRRHIDGGARTRTRKKNPAEGGA
jgi:hypothetical protein